MPTSNPLDILKSALLLEQRGKAFYEKTAENAGSQAVRDFFEKMAADEIKHVKILSDQYIAYKAEGKFAAQAQDDGLENVADSVLTDELKDHIKASGFESAAVSAAMGMEERAIKLYSQRADATEDPQEKALYQWLADWETQHLEYLARIDKEITESIWNDNNFWPF